VLDGSFLEGVDARKGTWRDAAAEAKGVLTKNFWTGQGRDALEVAYGTVASKPNATTVREVWKQRHGVRQGLRQTATGSEGLQRYLPQP
jgi:hypothetical protein